MLMVSRDGLEPSTHSLKETDTTGKIPILNKKPSFEAAAVYKGSKFWSILAEIYVVITIGALLFTLYLQFTS